MNFIPTDANQLGTMINYVQDGLVLHIDCLRPRRDGAIPTEATTLWEDLTGNYDCTIVHSYTFDGINPYTSNSNIKGGVILSDLPKNGSYYAEFIGSTLGDLLCFPIYANNRTGGVGLSTSYSAIFNDKNDVGAWKTAKTGTAPKACYQCHSDPDLARKNGEPISYDNRAEGWNLINVSNTKSLVVQYLRHFYKPLDASCL